MSSVAPFHTGQRVVAIRNHSQGRFKKGDEFTVLGIKKGCCDWLVNIGLEALYGHYECPICSNIEPFSDRMLWFFSVSFAPIQEISNETFEDIEQWILEQELQTKEK